MMGIGLAGRWRTASTPLVQVLGLGPRNDICLHRPPNKEPKEPNSLPPPPPCLSHSTLPRSMSTTATLSWLPRFTASALSLAATSCGRAEGGRRGGAGKGQL